MPFLSSFFRSKPTQAPQVQPPKPPATITAWAVNKDPINPKTYNMYPIGTKLMIVEKDLVKSHVRPDGSNIEVVPENSPFYEIILKNVNAENIVRDEGRFIQADITYTVEVENDKKDIIFKQGDYYFIEGAIEIVKPYYGGKRRHKAMRKNTRKTTRKATRKATRNSKK